MLPGPLWRETGPRPAARVRVLAELNRRLLLEYSRRTVGALRSALPLRLALPHLEPVLALNVAKEVHKDTLVIRDAGEALAANGAGRRDTVARLFEATKEIDRSFLSRVKPCPVGIVIRYQEIGPIRLKRIEQLWNVAYAILAAWQAVPGFRSAVRTAYPRAELEQLLHQLMRLYALEAKALSRSVRLPALLAPARDMVAEHLFRIMNESAIVVARDLCRSLYATNPGASQLPNSAVEAPKLAYQPLRNAADGISLTDGVVGPSVAVR